MPTGVHGAQSSPPVTAIAWPLMKRGAFGGEEHHELGDFAQFAHARPTGQYCSQNSCSGPDMPSRVMSVSKKPGTTTLLVMPLLPYSFASAARGRAVPALLAHSSPGRTRRCAPAKR